MRAIQEKTKREKFKLGLKKREMNTNNKKALLQELQSYFTVDKICHDPVNVKATLMKLDSEILQQALDYAKKYHNENYEKITFLRLGCYIDKLKIKKI